MRKSLVLLAMLSLVALPTFAQTADGGADQPADAPAPALAQTACQDAPASTVQSSLVAVPAPAQHDFQETGYPSCWSVHGTSCSPPGSWTRCQWTPYEPEICVCQSNYTWQCPG